MEKFNSPLQTTKSVDERTLAGTNLEELEVIYQKLPEKGQSAPTQVIVNDNHKIIKYRGEKRKLIDESDSLKKFKREKKPKKPDCLTYPNESNTLPIDQNNDIGGPHVEGDEPSTFQENIKLKKEDFTRIEIESDVENNEKPVKQKPSRKSKAAANKCKETLDVLLKYNCDVLEALDNSMKIIEHHRFLSDKYISVDILSDLISLALETNRKSAVVDFEKELSLLMIIDKCTNKLGANLKTPKARQSLTGVVVSPKNKSQEEVIPSTSATREEVLERGMLKSQILDETMEQCEISAVLELPEKVQEPAVEKSGKNFCITNYFKKLKKTVEERDKNERFSCFMTKTDMFLAPKLGGELTGERRQKFEEEFSSQNVESSYLAEHSSKSKNLRTKINNSNQLNQVNGDVENVNEPAEATKILSDGVEFSEATKSEQTVRKRLSLIRVDKPKGDPVEAVGRTKAKLFQFHDNRRPPYWGTWRKRSGSVGPRRPFGKDKMFNYEVDSDDEWEEEEEPGESLHGSDDEKEPEEDYEVDNDFFVPHGYLSDDENPEKENLSPKKKLDLLEAQFTSEQKQKTRKMTPVVFGTFWIHNGLPSEGNLYQDLQIDKLQYIPWTTIPVEIEEEEKNSENLPEAGEPASQAKKYKKKTFPDEEIPNLIKMIHGSPQNSDRLAKKFLIYWETEKNSQGNLPGLTKICVQKKIKELAAWQASPEKGKMCWLVPKETREEFGAEVEKKTPEKKPRKCFFWKFVRKTEKNPNGENTPPTTSAPPIEPEVIVLES